MIVAVSLVTVALLGGNPVMAKRDRPPQPLHGRKAHPVLTHHQLMRPVLNGRYVKRSTPAYPPPPPGVPDVAVPYPDDGIGSHTPVTVAVAKPACSHPGPDGNCA